MQKSTKARDEPYYVIFKSGAILSGIFYNYKEY